MSIKFKDAVQIISGGTPDTKTPSYWNGDIPWLSVVDFGSVNKYVSSTEKHISEAGLNNSATKMLKTDDIIISARGTVGAMAMLEKSMAFNQSCFGLRAKPEVVDQEFLFYYLRFYMKNITQKSQGSVFATINLDTFDMIDLNLPPLNVQKKIAKVLSDIDAKIDNNNAIAAELEGMAKDLYDYWFVQFDFPDENGKPYKSSGGKMVWNEEMKREIPEGWEVYQLDELFRFVKGRIPTEVFDTNDGNNLIPYLTIEAVNAVPTSYCKKQGMITTAGDTIMVMDGAASSETYVGHYGALGSTFAKLEKVNGRATDSFVYVIMQKYQSVFKKVNTGSTVPHANKDYISKFKVVLPQDDCLKNMAIKFDTWVQKQIQVWEENAELTSLRDFLLPMLMNGQVKVKGA